MTSGWVRRISGGGAGLEIVERAIPEPGPGQVRIKVQACGVCHSDALVVEGSWPGIPYPRVPGHEVAGIVDELGAGVTEWRKGQRVGVGSGLAISVVATARSSSHRPYTSSALPVARARSARD